MSKGTVNEKTRKRMEEEEKLIKERLSHIKHRLAIMSGKGGVGKSTVTVHIAKALRKRGYSVGILDADIHGPNIPKMVGLEGRRLEASNLGIIPLTTQDGIKVVSLGFLLEDQDSPIIWRGPLKHSAIRQLVGEVLWGDLDFLLVDLPPGTGDEPLSVAQVIKDLDGSIIVTTPQDVALLDSRKTVNFSKKLDVPVLGIVENMSGFRCPSCGVEINLFKIGGGERAAKELNVDFLGRVPIDPRVVDGGDSGKSAFELDENSDVAKAFLEITDKILDKLGEKNGREL